MSTYQKKNTFNYLPQAFYLVCSDAGEGSVLVKTSMESSQILLLSIDAHVCS